jgi:hypothetical protein
MPKELFPQSPIKSVPLTSFITYFATLALPLASVTMAQSFDFGTGPGKTTFESAGFTAVTGSGGTVTNMGDSVEVGRLDTAGGFENIGILGTFSGLGGGATNNFTITTELTLTQYSQADANNQRFAGIHLFADAADLNSVENSGIGLVLLGDSGTENDDIAIRNGVNGTTFAEENLVNDNFFGLDYTQGDQYRLVVDGVFSGSDLNIDFTFSRLDGSDSQLISTTVLAADFQGTFFGISGRLKAETTSEFGNFTVSVVPEPSAAALAISSLIGLTVFGRRRR